MMAVALALALEIIEGIEGGTSIRLTLSVDRREPTLEGRLFSLPPLQASAGLQAHSLNLNPHVKLCCAVRTGGEIVEFVLPHHSGQ